MGKQRNATLTIVAGGVGLLVGRILLISSPPDPTWANDGDLHLSLGLNLVLLGLAAWHLMRFGLGKLVVIGLLAAGALLTSLSDPGSGPPAWSRGYSGDELVGIWLFTASAVGVLLGVLWSYISERPTGSPTLWSYFFGERPATSEQHTGYVPPPPSAGDKRL